MSIPDNVVEEARLALSPKQRTFGEAYFETGSRTEAAITAYDCANRTRARVMAYRQLHNQKVRNYMDHLLLERGLADSVVDTLKDAMLANKTIRINDRLIYKPDHMTRMRAAKRVLRILGVF